METELSFLICLLLNDEVPKDIRILLKERIKLVEESFKPKQIPNFTTHNLVGTGFNQQAPSTQRILDSMPIQAQVENGTEPLASIGASTQATASALASRQKAIAIATSGKPEAGRTSPRKF